MGESNLRDKAGKIITTEEGKVNRWQEYFTELLNRPVPDVLLEGIEDNHLA